MMRIGLVSRCRSASSALRKKKPAGFPPRATCLGPGPYLLLSPLFGLSVLGRGAVVLGGFMPFDPLGEAPVAPLPLDEPVVPEPLDEPEPVVPEPLDDPVEPDVEPLLMPGLDDPVVPALELVPPLPEVLDEPVVPDPLLEDPVVPDPLLDERVVPEPLLRELLPDAPVAVPPCVEPDALVPLAEPRPDVVLEAPDPEPEPCDISCFLVCWLRSPVAGSPSACWNSLSAPFVCGPITPSTAPTL